MLDVSMQDLMVDIGKMLGVEGNSESQHSFNFHSTRVVHNGEYYRNQVILPSRRLVTTEEKLQYGFELTQEHRSKVQIFTDGSSVEAGADYGVIPCVDREVVEEQVYGQTHK